MDFIYILKLIFKHILIKNLVRKTQNKTMFIMVFFGTNRIIELFDTFDLIIKWVINNLSITLRRAKLLIVGPFQMIPVAVNDVAFSAHAILLSAVPVFQIAIYEVLFYSFSFTSHSLYLYLLRILN